MEEVTSLSNMYSHNFGVKFLDNIHHFTKLQQILNSTYPSWKGVGSYLMDGQTSDYCHIMFRKQCLLFDTVNDSKHALEIGVHGGHSLLIMLLSNPKLEITCIDACYFGHEEKCVKYLQKEFPDSKINFHKGSSVDILKQLKKTLSLHPPDFAHIDGNHNIDFIRAEAEILLEVMKPRDKIIFDDIRDEILQSKWFSSRFEVITIPDCKWANCFTKIK